MPQKLTQVQFLVLPKVKVQFIIWEILIQYSLVRSELIRSQSSHEIHTYLSFLCYLTLSRWKLSSSWWWWWPFQSTLLPFGPKPQIKQTKKRLCVYLLARQGIPVIFMLSYKQPRRKLSSAWWWWWWSFQCTCLLFRPEPQIKQMKNRLCVYRSK